MVLMDIYKIFEKRKRNMEELLQNNSHSIALEKKHEIQGAVAEIDIFLRTLEYFQNQPQNGMDNIDLGSTPEKKSGLFSRFLGKKE